MRIVSIPKPEVKAVDQERRSMISSMGLRYALLRFLPFLGRWMEVTPCCGTCPTCGVIGVTGIAANFVGSMKADRGSRDPRDDVKRGEAT